MPRGRKPYDGKPIGSTRTDRDGYIIVKVSAHPHVWMLAHRWAMEQKLGRHLSPSELVHHTCGDRACHDPDHLELTDFPTHTQRHASGRRQSWNQVERRRKKQRLWWLHGDRRLRRAEHMRQLWSEPEYRKRQRESRLASWAGRKKSR